MKRFSFYLLVLISFTVPFCAARVVSPGESLWNMQRLVTQASCDVTIRQSDFTAGVFTISSSGVYCLAENMTGKIVIDQDSVVLDINGKTITNTADDCIEVNGKSKIIIESGSVISSNNIGIHIEPGSSQVTLKNVVIRDCMEGMLIESSSNVYVNACDFIASTTGVILNNASRTIVSNTTVSDSIYVGFQLVSSSKNQFLNCSALNTGQGLTDLVTDIYGFFASNGSSNIFSSCIAQNTLALTVTGSSNVVAGFAFSGTETKSEISNCISNVTQTDADGFATPFGILLQYSFDALVPVTGEAQGAFGLSVAWSPDGAYLASGGVSEGTDEIQIFSFDRSTETLITITGENQGSSCDSVAWSPDGAYLASGGLPEGGDEIQVFSFDPVAGLLTKTDGKNQGSSSSSVAWSPDGAYLASGGEPEGGDEIQIFSFDRSTGILTKLDGASQGTIVANSVAWSPDGTYLASGGQTEPPGDEIQIFSFDRSTGTLTKTDGENQGAACFSVAWSPDGAYLASGGSATGSDGIQIFSFDRSTGTLTKTDGENQGIRCRSLAWSPDGAYLATGGDPEGSDEIQIFSFDRSTETLTKIDAENQGTECDGIAWAPDGVYLASTGDREGSDDIRVFKAFIFPSRNNISNNSVQSASGPSPLVAGVGISGSSIENMIIGNSSFNNAGFNYQFVTNVFDSRFTSAPTLVQNLSINTTPPFYAP